MDTKKIQLKGKEKRKGGFNNTQTILTAAGAAVVGAAAGAAIASTNKEDEIVDLEGQTEEVIAEDEGTETQTEELQATTEHVAEPSDGNITEPQPIDSAATQHPSNSSTTANSGTSSEELTPEQVAEQIIAENNIDPKDIDAPNVVAVDELITVYDEFGNQVPAALVHTPDGWQFLLADADGDGVFEGVYDTYGNFVAMAEGNLIQSDLETMIDQSGGYMALTENDHPSGGEDPTVDIVDTETGQHVDIAQLINGESGNSTTVPSEEEMDDLLAQLLGNDDPESGVPPEEVLVDEEVLGGDLAIEDGGDNSSDLEPDFS